MELGLKTNLRINIPINPLSIKYKIIRCKECNNKEYKKRDTKYNLLIKRYISMNDNLKYMLHNLQFLYITHNDVILKDTYDIIDKYIKNNIPKLNEYKRYNFTKMYSKYVLLVKTCEILHNKLIIYNINIYTANYNPCCVPKFKNINIDIINEKKYLDF